MSGIRKQFVDFSNNTNNDTGENTAASIQPIQNGNPLDATNLARPSESLRQRTEAIRDAMGDSQYLLDADRKLVIAGPGLVTWPGSTTAAASGIVSLTDVLYVLPLLTPGFAQTAPVPPVASVFGTLHLKRADNANAILVTSMRRSYAGGDRINITVSAGGSFSCVLDTETGYSRTIKIVATNTTTLSTVISALNGLLPPSPDNTQLVNATLEGGALGSDLILTTQAKQYISGNYDGEGHAITPANLAAFFTANPTQALAEGDTLCVSYADVIDTTSTGGRRQSVPENSNTAVPVGSFFNSRVHPENLVNALPICKVVNNTLVFATGSQIVAGASGVSLSATNAASVSYAGGPNWADGTTNPATSVENQLDKIISDLAGSTGTGKIKGSAVGTYLGAVTLASQLSTMANFVHDDKPPTEASRVPLRVFRDWQNNARSLIDHNGFRLGQVSEIDEHWRGHRSETVRLAAQSGVGTGSVNGGPYQVSAGQVVDFPLENRVPQNATVTSVVIYYDAQTISATFTAAMLRTGALTGTFTTPVSRTVTFSDRNSFDLMASPTSGHGPQTMLASDINQIRVTAAGGNAGILKITALEITFTMDPAGWSWSGTTENSLTAGDARNYLDPDANLNQRSVQLVTASDGSTSGLSGLVSNADVWIGADTIFVMDFMVRTGTIDDATHAAQFNIGILGSSGSVNAASLYWDHSYANWMLRTQVGLGLTDNAAGGVAVTANTNYRVRLEIRGSNRTTSGLLEIYVTINGVAAAVVTPAFTAKAFKVFATASCSTNTVGGPYDMRIGRLRRVFNHLAAGDVL